MGGFCQAGGCDLSWDVVDYETGEAVRSWTLRGLARHPQVFEFHLVGR